jgi:hypothetical protein
VQRSLVLIKQATDDIMTAASSHAYALSGIPEAVERDLALIMVVGEGMRYGVGLAAKATAALAQAGVNIEMMNQGSSEISMMFGVKNGDRALTTIAFLLLRAFALRGVQAATPGHAAAPNDRQLRATDMALLDMGAEYHGYVSDITCSFPVAGVFSEDQRVIYNGVLAAQRAVLEVRKAEQCSDVVITFPGNEARYFLGALPQTGGTRDT